MTRSSGIPRTAPPTASASGQSGGPTSVVVTVHTAGAVPTDAISGSNSDHSRAMSPDLGASPAPGAAATPPVTVPRHASLPTRVGFDLPPAPSGGWGGIPMATPFVAAYYHGPSVEEWAQMSLGERAHVLESRRSQLFLHAGPHVDGHTTPSRELRNLVRAPDHWDQSHRLLLTPFPTVRDWWVTCS